MKNNKVLYFELGSFVFCLIFSAVNHFLFEMSDGAMILAPFVPVNESVWEHGKLFFFPFLFYAIIEFFFLKDNKNFIFAKSLPLTLSVPFMIVCFYTYTGILGFHVLALDLILSLTIVLFMNLISYKILISEKQYCSKPLVALVIITLIAFIVFTFVQIKIALFLDTTTGTYGIPS